MRDLGLGDERDLCGSVSVSASTCSRSELLYSVPLYLPLPSLERCLVRLLVLPVE
jgi:hypothetical protein